MVGSFATSKAGHDKERLYVILKEEGDYVSLCDGKIRTLANPKKKKKRHIQIINRKVSGTVLAKLEKNLSGACGAQEKISDEEIRNEIRKYSNQTSEW